MYCICSVPPLFYYSYSIESRGEQLTNKSFAFTFTNYESMIKVKTLNIPPPFPPCSASPSNLLERNLPVFPQGDFSPSSLSRGKFNNSSPGEEKELRKGRRSSENWERAEKKGKELRKRRRSSVNGEGAKEKEKELRIRRRSSGKIEGAQEKGRSSGKGEGAQEIEKELRKRGRSSGNMEKELRKRGRGSGKVKGGKGRIF